MVVPRPHQFTEKKTPFMQPCIKVYNFPSIPLFDIMTHLNWPADKPGSVVNSHLSRMCVTTHLKQPTQIHVWAAR